MKILNSDNFLNPVPLIYANAQMHKCNILGKNFCFDVNSMRLFEFSEKEKNINFQELALEECPYIEQQQEFAHKHIVFQATYACNCKCRYCFVAHHYCDHKNTMTEQEHYDAIKKFQPNGPYKIGWFGGEPLMNWEVIFRVVENVCKESKEKNLPDPQFHITSNGTLLTEEIAEYCAEKNFSWIVSLDGPEHIHNNNRPYKDGQGTFQDAMRGLTYLKNAYRNKNNSITLRATFDTENFDILESTKFLNQLMYEGYAAHVSVEPSTLGEGCGTKSRIEELNLKEIRAIFSKQYEETAKWFVEEIKAGRKPSLHHFEVPMQRLYDREPAFNECGAGIGYISIGPGGKICACHREHQTEIGSMQKGIDQIKQAKWKDGRFFNRTLCLTCWRRYVCGGGCRCNSLLINHTINAPSITECLFHDLHIRTAIWILSELTDEQKKLYSKKRNNQGQRQPAQQISKIQESKKFPIIPQEKMVMCKTEDERKKLLESCQKNCQYDCQVNCMYANQAKDQVKSCAIDKKNCDCQEKNQ